MPTERTLKDLTSKVGPIKLRLDGGVWEIEADGVIICTDRLEVGLVKLAERRERQAANA